MRLIKPETLAFGSASENEDDAPVWASGTTYNLGDYVIRSGFLYVSSINANLGIDPATEVQELEGVRWVLVAATNVRRFIDGTLNTKTEGSSPMVLEATVPAFSNAVALFGLVGSEVLVEAIVGGAPVASETIQAGPEMVSNWWSWYNAVFHPVIRRVVIPDFPLVAGATLRVTVHGDAPALGLLVAGRAYRLGATLLGQTTGVRRRTFTDLTTDAFGATKATKRAVARNVTYEVLCKRADFSAIEAVLDAVDGIPVVTFEDSLAQELVNFGHLLDVEVPSKLPDDFVFPVTNQGVI